MKSVNSNSKLNKYNNPNTQISNSTSAIVKLANGNCKIFSKPFFNFIKARVKILTNSWHRNFFS